MAGRKGTTPRPLVLAQTPGVDDPKTQRAIDVLDAAVKELQKRPLGGGVSDVFTATADGLAPASGGDAGDVLHADGTWAPVVGGVSSVTGSGLITCTPTTGDVIVSIDLSGYSQDGHTHVKADVTDFAHTHVIADVTDFAHTHVIADVTDLGAFTDTDDGLVPAPNSGTAENFLREDGTWADVTTAAGDALFGTGADGALDFDGTSVVAGLTPSAGVYTLVRTIQGTTVVCSGTGSIIANGFRVLGTESITDLVIHADGNDGSSGTGGTGHPAGFLGGGTNAGSSASGNGNANASALPTLVPTSTAANNGAGGGAGLDGVAGSVGTTMRGGGGGCGGNIIGAGGSGGTVTRTAATAGIETVWALVQGKGEQTTTRWTFGTGGGAGGAGGGGGFGGGGGGGAGCVVVCAPLISGGTFTAIGGDGGVPQVGAPGGGGGGGGGGLIVLVFRARVGGTTSVLGGQGSAGGVGATTGGAGGDGGDGVVCSIRIRGGVGGGGGGLNDGDYGDITVSAGGSTWVIDTNAVTTAKIADDNVTMAKIEDAAGARLVGALAAGSPSYLTGTQATALLDLATTSVKGLAPVLPNDATKYLDGTGSYSVPAGGGGGGAFGGVSVRNSGALVSVSGTEKLMTFDTEIFDTSGYHSTSSDTSRLVAPSTGYYYCLASCEFQSSASGYRQLKIEKNAGGSAGAGTALASVRVAQAAGAVTDIQTSCIVYLTAGDYVEVFALQNSGSNLNVAMTTERWSFAMYSLGNSPAASTPVFSGVSVYNSVALSTTSATWKLLTFNTERFDTGGLHDSSSNTSRLVAPVTGYYHITATCYFDANATGYRQIVVEKNATGSIGSGTYVTSDLCAPTSAAVLALLNASGTMHLTAGDYVECWAFQNSGGALNVNTDATAVFEMFLAGV